MAQSLTKLDAVLQMYTFNLLSKEARHACELWWGALGDKADTFVAVENKEASDRALQTALAMRVPIHMGRPLGHMYNEEALVRTFGYTTAQALAAHAHPEVAKARFAICGPLWAPRRGAHTPWAIHAYAPNFEAPDTYDAHTLLRQGHLNRAEYATRVSQLYVNIRRCVHEIARRAGASSVSVFVPAMGMGNFLCALGQHERRAAIEANIRAMIADLGGSGFDVCLCIPDDEVHAIAQARMRRMDPFAFPQGVRLTGPGADGNLFDKLASVSDDCLAIFVNAWDNLALIGNGGLQDSSVDGYFVAGYGPNRDLINGSFMHNVIFQPHLLNPAGWLRPPCARRVAVDSEWRLFKAAVEDAARA